ncbi:MAG: 50S ribosomal protein L24 [Deltaproteobacteria bacterium]
MSLARIRQGDTVMVISGKDKGKTGKVLRVFPDVERVTVEKLNLVKRHTKPTQTQREGGIFEREQPMHLSKVMPIDPVTTRPTRVRTKRNDDGSKVRVAVKSGNQIPDPPVEKKQ